MTFIRRKGDDSPAHRCKTPQLRYIPWPHWGDGAIWMCGYPHWDGMHETWRGGCGQRWIYLGYPWNEWRKTNG